MVLQVLIKFQSTTTESLIPEPRVTTSGLRIFFFFFFTVDSGIIKRGNLTTHVFSATLLALEEKQYSTIQYTIR